jgi:hypothetical protein
MDLLDARQCPVCGRPLLEPPSRRDRPRADLAFYNCVYCGRFGMTRPAVRMLPSRLDASYDSTGDRVASFAHVLRRMQMAQEWPILDSNITARIIETATLPTVQEQADNLVRWLGETHPHSGESAEVSFEGEGAVMGVHSTDGFHFVLAGLMDSGLIRTSQMVRGRALVVLTFAGWRRFQELKIGASSGRKAFMAMQYGDPELDRIVDEHFRTAVKETGFELFRLDDEPKAGLLDDRMRVEIKSARFMIAELTHGNRGAYWEAGYADGLGKPVIYTCKESAWSERKTHFDTNHHLHVLWNPEDIAAGMTRLKATIRVTIPEATRQDS